MATASVTQKETPDTNGHSGSSANVGQVERWISTIGGSALAVYGLTRRTWTGTALALVGSSLVYRGTSGHCPAYEAIGVSTAELAQRGIHVEKSLTISQPPEVLYRFWRDFENLPRIMDHLESVTRIDDRNSHWVAKAPAGTMVEWDAEVTEDRPNERIAWQSLEGSGIENSGTVRFEPATGGRGTVVRVSLQYKPPAGVLGAAVAKLFGEEPQQQVSADLRRFKQLMEAGEIPTVQGQPSGRRQT